MPSLYKAARVAHQAAQQLGVCVQALLSYSLGCDQKAQHEARRATRDTGDTSSSDLSYWEHGAVASAAGRWRSGSVEVIRWTCGCCGHDDGCAMQVSPA